MKSKGVRQMLAGVLGLAVLVGDVFGGSMLTAYAEEESAESVYAEEGTDAESVESTEEIVYSTEGDADESESVYSDDEGTELEDVDYTIYMDSHQTEITVSYGETATLEMSAESEAELTYTWYLIDGGTWVKMDGATGSIYVTDGITEYSWYVCEVSNALYSDTFSFLVNVETGLEEIGYDGSYTVDYGGSASLSAEGKVTVDDGYSLSYQWYVVNDDGTNVDIEGETETSYTTDPITAYTMYGCRVTDSCGNSVYLQFYIYIDTGLSVDENRFMYYVQPGDKVELSAENVTVNEGYSLSYEWYGDWELIEGATESTYITDEINEYSYYYCVVSDDSYNRVYVYYEIYTDTGLCLEDDGFEYRVDPGDTVTLSVMCVTTYPGVELTYQWYDEDGAIEGATEADYTTGEITTYSLFQCIVTDPLGNSVTLHYEVYIDTGLSVDQSSFTEYADYDSTLTLYAEGVTTDYDLELSYQWYKDWEPIEGETGTSCVTDKINSYSIYYCIVSDGCGNTVIVFYNIYVNNNLEISYDTSDIKIGMDETAELTVEASCDNGSVTYTWYCYVNEYYKDLSFTETNSDGYSTLPAEYVTATGFYHCYVEDEYGNTDEACFYVKIDTGLGVGNGKSDYCVYVDEGKTAVLDASAVTAYDGVALSYQWYDNGDEIEDATCVTLETEPVYYRRGYSCEVSDEYGNMYILDYCVYVDNNVEVSHESDVHVSYGEDVTLSFTVTAKNMDNMSYEWAYCDYEDGADIELNEYDTEITLTNVTSGGTYYCYLKDGYGNNQYIWFYVTVDTISEPAVEISECAITLGTDSYTYDGTAKNPSVTVKDGNYTLVKNTDYTVEYSNNTDAGTAKVTVTGIGDYTGEVEKTFTINKASQTVAVSISASSISIGSTASITASGTGTITYSSSNTSVATVSSSGVVTGVAKGTAVITVKAAGNSNYNEATTTVSITVNKLSQTVSVNAKGSTSINVGSTTTWTAKTTGTGAITYSVDNGSVASVNSITGVVTANAVGTVNVYATAAANSTYNASSKTLIATITVGLAASSISSVVQSKTNVTVTWSAVSGAEGYYVYTSTSKSSGYSLLTTITSGTTVSYKDTSSKTNGTTYYYKVVAYNGSTKSADSSVVSIKYMKAAVSSLTNTSKGIKVEWKKVSGATGYYIYRKAGSGSYKKVKTITKGSTVSWTDTSVKSKNGTTYTYYVQPYNKTSKGAYSTKKTVRLTAVSISSLKNSASKTLTVKYKENSKASGYQIQYSTSKTFASSKTKSVTVTKSSTFSKKLTKLTKGKTYYVRVRAYKKSGSTKYYSAWSSKKSKKVSK